MLQHAFLLGLLAAPACQAAPSQAGVQTDHQLPPSATITQPLPAAPSVYDRIPDAAERAVLSVVNIATETTVKTDPRTSPFGNPMFREFFGQGHPQLPQEHIQQGRGSGVIVGVDGLILTNNHVVGSADEILVTLSDGREFAAEVVGTDARSDVAVVKMVDPPADLVALPWGDSAALRLGEVVLAVGNPFGIGQTVTMGIVSAKGRANLGIVDYEDFIQTDAAINPGNSGGALVNLNGELVGINTAIISGSGGYQGVGFAIPVQMARRIADDLLGDGKVDRGFLGVMIQDLDDGLRAALDLGSVDGGVLISDVTAGSAAESAGFRRSDVVVEFDGAPVKNATAFRMAVADAGADKGFKAVVIRDGKRKKLSGTLGTLEDEASPGAEVHGQDVAKVDLGLSLTALTPALRQRLQIPDRVSGGVVVEDVQQGSHAARAGMRSGDVILEVNRRAVQAPADVAQAVRDGDDRVLLLVLRSGATVYVVIPR